MSRIIRLHAHQSASYERRSYEFDVREQTTFEFELRAEDLPVFSYFSCEGAYPAPSASDEQPEPPGA